MRSLLPLFFLIAGLTTLSGQPNLIFILIDDQGYYDLSCYGATEVETPRIDGMASEGVRFTDYYAAAPICSPSRAGLLTGAYPRRIGLEAWVQRADSKRGIPPDLVTLPELLQDNGYATACIGKWHLGDHAGYRPLEQGFDYYFGLLHNLDPVETIYFEDEGGVPIVRNGEVVKRPADPVELTQLYTDEALAFMEKHKDEPFFLYLPHTMLHNPLGASERFLGSSNWDLYGDAIQELDYNIGRLLDGLQELGIADETLVVYASDNGRGPGRNPEQPFQGRKLTTWEAGIRVPCIAWGPGLGVQQGVESSALVHAMDWYPTFATYADLKVPGQACDGRDLRPLLAGEVDAPSYKNDSLNAKAIDNRYWDPPLEWKDLVSKEDYFNAFFYHGAEGSLAAVRSGKWKLSLSPSLTLYDLEADPGETKFARSQEMIRTLRGMAIMFQEEMSLDHQHAPGSPTVDGE